MVLVRCWLGNLPINPSLQYRACLKMCSNTFFCNLALLSHLQPPWQSFVNDFRAVCGCASLSQGKKHCHRYRSCCWASQLCTQKEPQWGGSCLTKSYLWTASSSSYSSQHVLHLAQHLEVKPLEYHMNSAMGKSLEWCSNKNSDSEKTKR